VRAAGSWINSLALENAGGAAGLAAMTAETALALAELCASSLMAAPILESQLLPPSSALAAADESTTQMEDDELSVVAKSTKKSVKQKAVGARPLTQLLDVAEASAMQQRVNLALAPMHERLKMALIALREAPPSWQAQLAMMQQGICRGNVRLLAACQLGGLWRGLPDDSSSPVAASVVSGTPLLSSSTVLPSDVAKLESSSATAASSSPSTSGLPIFNMSDFLPTRSSELLYTRRFRDFSTFAHPATPTWNEYADAFIRKPALDIPLHLPALLQVGGWLFSAAKFCFTVQSHPRTLPFIMLQSAEECFADAFVIAGRLEKLLETLSSGVVPIATAAPTVPDQPKIGQAVHHAKSSKRADLKMQMPGTSATLSGSAPIAVNVISSSADIIYSAALLSDVSKSTKVSMACRVAARAVSKDSRVSRLCVPTSAVHADRGALEGTVSSSTLSSIRVDFGAHGWFGVVKIPPPTSPRPGFSI
jgi:hypothetical protein